MGFGEKNIATIELWNAHLTQYTCPILVKPNGAYIHVYI